MSLISKRYVKTKNTLIIKAKNTKNEQFRNLKQRDKDSKPTPSYTKFMRKKYMKYYHLNNNLQRHRSYIQQKQKKNYIKIS